MIEVSHLTKRYGETLALDDVSFSVDTGSVCGLLGPNGAGKSTTMNIMTGCLSATSGEVRYDGLEIYADMNAVKGTIGYLPEQPPLYLDMTVSEYLEFVARAKRVPRKELGDSVMAASLSCGVSQVADRLIKHLSKGYKQRVGIAQALLGEPDVIILDEPTVGLDPIQIIEIRNLIRFLAQSHTVVVSSHILSEIRTLCDQIVIISKGKLVANDTPDNLEMRLAGSRSTTLTLRAKAERAVKLLATIPHVADVVERPLPSRRENKGCVQFVVTAEGSHDIRDDLFQTCVAENIHVLEMSTKHASLEDVFIELTEQATGDTSDGKGGYSSQDPSPDHPDVANHSEPIDVDGEAVEPAEKQRETAAASLLTNDPRKEG